MGGQSIQMSSSQYKVLRLQTHQKRVSLKISVQPTLTLNNLSTNSGIADSLAADKKVQELLQVPTSKLNPKSKLRSLSFNSLLPSKISPIDLEPLPPSSNKLQEAAVLSDEGYFDTEPSKRENIAQQRFTMICKVMREKIDEAFQDTHRLYSREILLLLYDLRNLLERDSVYDELLSATLLIDIVDCPFVFYFSESQILSLMSLVLEYMQRSRQKVGIYLGDTIPSKNESFHQEFGQRWLKLKNQALSRSKNGFKILSYLLPFQQNESSLYDHCFLEAIYDFSEEEVRSVAKAVKKQCEFDMRAFLFLSSYLMLSCEKLSESGKSVVEIQNTLISILAVLAKENPPSTPIKGEDRILYYHRDQKLSRAQKSFKEIDLRQVDQKDRAKYVEDFILNEAKQASNQFITFNDLTRKICLQEGYHFRSGLKISEKNKFRAIQRVKEKMLEDAYFKAKQRIQSAESKRNEHDSLDEFINSQLLRHRKIERNIYEEADTIIKFAVDDLLRAKCMFANVQNINKTCTRLKQQCEAKGFKIRELKNRLKQKTSDLILKIQVGSCIAELQLAIDFKVVENEFNHKIYELLRSKFYSPLVMLYILNKDLLNDYCPELQTIIEVKLKTEVKSAKRNTIEDFKNSFQFFKEKVSYKQKIYSQPNIGIKQMRTRLNNISKSTITPSKDIESFKKNKHNRNAMYYFEVKEFYKAEKQQLLHCHKCIILSKALFNKLADGLQNILPSEKQMVQQYAEALKQLAEIKYKLDKRQQALNLLSQYQQITKMVSSEISMNSVKVYIQIGNIQRDNDKSHLALQNYEQALVKLNRIEHPNKILEEANILIAIANVFREEGSLSKAIDYLIKALKICQKYSIKQVPIRMNQIGIIYLQQQKYDEAKRYLEMGLEVAENSFGQYSQAWATIESNLGLVYLQQEKYQQARKSLEESLQIFEIITGKYSFQFSRAIFNVALLYHYMGQYYKSLRYYKKALNKFQRIQGLNNSKSQAILFGIGLNYLKLSRAEEAYDSFEKALKMSQTIKDSRFENAIYLAHMALSLRYLDKFEEADKHFRSSIQLYREFEKQNDDLYVDILISAGSNLLVIQNYEEALRLFQEANSLFECVYGADPLKHARLLLNLALLMSKTEQYAQAIDNFYNNQRLSVSINSIFQSDGQMPYSIGLFPHKEHNFKEIFPGINKRLSAINYIEDYQRESDNLIVTSKSKQVLKKASMQVFKEKERSQIFFAAKKRDKKVSYWNNLKNIAITNCHLNNWEAALPYFKRSSEVCSDIYGQFSKQYAQSLLQRGICESQIQQLAESLATFMQCLCIYEFLQGKNSLNCARVQQFLGDVTAECCEGKKMVAALVHYTTALRILENLEATKQRQLVEQYILTQISSLFSQMNFEEELALMKKFSYPRLIQTIQKKFKANDNIEEASFYSTRKKQQNERIMKLYENPKRQQI